MVSKEDRITRRLSGAGTAAAAVGPAATSAGGTIIRLHRRPDHRWVLFRCSATSNLRAPARWWLTRLSATDGKYFHDGAVSPHDRVGHAPGMGPTFASSINSWAPPRPYTLMRVAKSSSKGLFAYRGNAGVRSLTKR